MNDCTILCVDDDASLRRFYEVFFRAHGYRVYSAADGRECLQILESVAEPFDAFVLDYEMPGMNGAELAAELKRRNPHLPILMITGDPTVVENVPPFVDAALQKGVKLTVILEQLEFLLTPGRTILATSAANPMAGGSALNLS